MTSETIVFDIEIEDESTDNLHCTLHCTCQKLKLKDSRSSAKVSKHIQFELMMHVDTAHSLARLNNNSTQRHSRHPKKLQDHLQTAFGSHSDS